MSSDSILHRINTTIDQDVSELWNVYASQGGGPDESGFLDYLHQSGAISTQAFCDLHTRDAIEVTNYGELVTSFFHAQTGDGTARTPSSDPHPSRFDLMGQVGRGAMGEVHVARDLDLRRKVAWKQMVGQTPSRELARRFLSEMQITAQLDHPSIVPIYSVEQTEDSAPAYVMKLIQGSTLAEVLQEARVQVRDRGSPDEDHALLQRLEHFLKICDALYYAHSKGVIHRDLKPENIMIGRFGEVYVMDWGIARLLESNEVEGVDTPEAPTQEELARIPSHQRTQMGKVVGTPAYMAPEQAKGNLEALGAHTDIFALGLVLYEITLLRPAYNSSNSFKVFSQALHAKKSPVRPVNIGEEVTSDLFAIIHKATALKPEDRYASADALADDIRRMMRGEATKALPDSLWRRSRRWLVRHQRVTFTAIVAIITSLIVMNAGILLYQQWQVAQQHRESRASEYVYGEVVADVTAQSQRIDSHFLWYEGQLEGLAGAAQHAMRYAAPISSPNYSAKDYRKESTSPPNMVYSNHYNRPISPDYPVYKVAPGIRPSVWRPDLGKLNTVRLHQRSMFLTSPDNPTMPTTEEERRARITGDQVPMEWAFMALERSGLMITFPGAEGWDDHYDPRTRPWYRQALDTDGRTWGKPYADLMRQGLLISCVKSLTDTSGEFIGVAGIDIKFTYLIETYMNMEDEPAFRGSYLIDENNQVIVESAARDTEVIIPETRVLDPGIDLGTLPYPDVLLSLGSRPAGYAVTQDPAGQEVVVVWSRLRQLGWSYVVVMDAQMLIQRVYDQMESSP